MAWNSHLHYTTHLWGFRVQWYSQGHSSQALPLLCVSLCKACSTEYCPNRRKKVMIHSQPLSFIMWASSMINFPSLYFWLLSKACSWKKQKSRCCIKLEKLSILNIKLALKTKPGDITVNISYQLHQIKGGKEEREDEEGWEGNRSKLLISRFSRATTQQTCFRTFHVLSLLRELQCF